LQKFFDTGIKIKRIDRLQEDDLISYFMYAGEVLAQQPDLFDKFVDFGIKIGEKTYRGMQIYMYPAKEIATKKPEIFNEYLSRTFMNEEKNKIYPSNPKIWLERPEFIEKCSHDASKLLKITDEVDGFINTAEKIILKFPQLYEKFARVAANILKKSENAAEKFFNDFEKIEDLKDEEEKKSAESNFFLKMDFLDSMQNFRRKSHLKRKYEKRIYLADEIYSENSLKIEAYRAVQALIKYMHPKGAAEKKYTEILETHFTKDFLDIIDKNKNIIIHQQENYPEISKYLKAPSSFPEYKLLLKNNQYLEEDSLSDVTKRLFKEINHFLSKQCKMPEDTLREFMDLNSMFESYELIDYVNITFNRHSFDDYITKIDDCLSFLQSHSKESLNFIKNPYSHYLSVNSIWHKEFRGTIGRAIMTEATINEKNVIYVAGFSGSAWLDYVPHWEGHICDAIAKFAESNKDKIDGIFFDLNPMNRTRHSHEFAVEAAKQLGMKENVDYTYTKRSMSTPENPTSKKQIIFQTNKLEWTPIRFKRKRGDDGYLFLESVAIDPNDPSKNNGMIQDFGYVKGKYVGMK
jgi:hypothetical protein